ncbi:MAG TPA: ParB/RepB/Spo0J family partition protein [Erysipelothrix sp.]|nr:ParB/RepB/Spo0J family partition protein [Erysipelothrix sp.]
MTMSDSRSKLGKGLGAIFGENIDQILEDIEKGQSKEFETTSMDVPINEIRTNPYQPRKQFDQQALVELSESIKQFGIITPILIRKSVQGFELIAGERRLRASKMADLKEIPAIIVDFSDEMMMEVALIENVQRENLNVVEEAQGYQNMITHLGYTQEQIAQRINKSRTHVANLLRLLKLPNEVLEMVVLDQLTMGHVRPLITLSSTQQMIDIAKKAYHQKMTVREVESYIKQLGQPQGKKTVKILPKKKYLYPIELLEKRLQTGVTIKKQQIVIDFIDDEDLNRILELMDALED